jgi:hypothetical protein
MIKRTHEKKARIICQSYLAFVQPNSRVSSFDKMQAMPHLF